MAPRNRRNRLQQLFYLDFPFPGGKKKKKKEGEGKENREDVWQEENMQLVPISPRRRQRAAVFLYYPFHSRSP